MTLARIGRELPLATVVGCPGAHMRPNTKNPAGAGFFGVMTALVTSVAI